MTLMLGRLRGCKGIGFDSCQHEIDGGVEAMLVASCGQLCRVSRGEREAFGVSPASGCGWRRTVSRRIVYTLIRRAQGDFVAEGAGIQEHGVDQPG